MQEGKAPIRVHIPDRVGSIPTPASSGTEHWNVAQSHKLLQAGSIPAGATKGLTC